MIDTATIYSPLRAGISFWDCSYCTKFNRTLHLRWSKSPQLQRSHNVQTQVCTSSAAGVDWHLTWMTPGMLFLWGSLLYQKFSLSYRDKLQRCALGGILAKNVTLLELSRKKSGSTDNWQVTLPSLRQDKSKDKFKAQMHLQFKLKMLKWAAWFVKYRTGKQTVQPWRQEEKKSTKAKTERAESTAMA